MSVDCFDYPEVRTTNRASGYDLGDEAHGERFFGRKIMVGLIRKEKLLCFVNGQVCVVGIDRQYLSNGALELADTVFQKRPRPIALPANVMTHELGVGITRPVLTRRSQQHRHRRRMHLAQSDSRNLAGRVLQYVVYRQRISYTAADRVDEYRYWIAAFFIKLVKPSDELFGALVAYITKQVHPSLIVQDHRLT